MEPAEVEAAGERHASWIELFFDLVVVAGIAQLTHLLHEEVSFANVGLYAVLFVAFWSVWACFMMYGNIAGDAVRSGAVLLAMLGLGVMAAAVPEVRTDRTVVFIVAYVLLRWLAGRVWKPGEIVVDLPLAQYALGAFPWLVSIWVDPPYRYWLWAAGLAIDLALTFTVTGGQMVESAQRKVDEILKRRGPHPTRAVEVVAAPADVAHLGERLGLLVIIVLGEGVVQVTTSASQVEWDARLVGTALGAFVLLIALLVATLLDGFAGMPHIDAGAMPAHTALGLHCLVTGALAALAAGLGFAVGHAEGGLGVEARWLMCGSLAVFVAIGAIAGLVQSSSRRWALGWGVPCTIVPVVLGALGTRVPVVALVWVLAVVVGWLVVYDPSRIRQRFGPERTADA
jgi:low temperature requirement protein LtrA